MLGLRGLTCDESLVVAVAVADHDHDHDHVEETAWRRRQLVEFMSTGCYRRRSSSSASRNTRALSSVSATSRSGSLAATRPPPA